MLHNKTILLTGATDGIGKQTALELAKRGAILLMHGRNKEKGHKIKADIIAKTANKNIFYYNADFTSFEEIKQLSDTLHKDFSHLDIIVNNAGIFENQKIILANGIEKNFMVNHLASFSLSLQLLDLVEKSNHGHIINVSSMIHANHIDFDNLNGEKQYSGESAYSLTKLCNILFTNKLNKLFKDKNIRTNSLHPGVINTKLLAAGWGPFGSPTIEGAKRILYLAESKGIETISGKYFVDDRVREAASIAYDESVMEQLWDVSLRYVV